ncbi:hypothetical protein CsSME_00023561 [Camellia sinensis var. sinensis]
MDNQMEKVEDLCCACVVQYHNHHESIYICCVLCCIMHRILSGVMYCHKHRIMHQDLKPDNMLIDLNASVVKIADFGMARAFHIPLRAYSPEQKCKMH